MRETSVYIFDGTDPITNLALETRLFESADTDTRLLILWQNTKSIFLGRSQNPWLECNLRKVRESGVILARRQSGGGTVYHAPGNLNISFISAHTPSVRERNTAFLEKALREIGVEAEKNDRNDLFLQGKKISGSAYRITKGKILHHCTLLIDADLGDLKQLLTPSCRVEESKGIQSVRSPVINIREVVPGLGVVRIRAHLAARFAEQSKLASARGVPVPPGDLRDNRYEELFSLFSSWDWVFGRTPQCILRFTYPAAGRGGDLLMTLNHGCIERVDSADGAGAGPGIVETAAGAGGGGGLLRQVSGALSGTRFRREDIARRLAPLLERTRPESRDADFLRWFAGIDTG
jgi:lipoate-protein ligase A